MEGAGQLVSTLGQLVGDEYRVLSSVGGQVAELRDELATMNAILRMQSEADDGTVDHFVREWMKQVRDLAADAEDSVEHYIYRIHCRMRDLGFIRWSKHLLATLFSRHRLAGEIQGLRVRAVAISERHVRYSASREALISRSASTPLALGPAVSATYVPDLICRASHELVGISDKANSLADKMKAVKNDAGSLRVFTIVGFGGLGKTTLAMEVFRQLEAEFELQAHVSVSRMFNVCSGKDLTTLLKRLLQQFGNLKSVYDIAHMNCMRMDELAIKLHEIVAHKRYLLVIDDVWTISAWDAIRQILPGNDTDSTVLVTTRIETVAKACSFGSLCGDQIYQIQPLSREYSKQLFLSRAFGSKDASCPRDLENVMDNILRKCAGLPIAIASIAGLLSGYKSPGSIDIWERIYKSISSQMEGNPTAQAVRQILTVSYNHLPHYLKGCVMYVSIFPENYIISKDRLLWGWMAEGLVEYRMGFTLLEVAEQYFDELVCRRIIVLAKNEIITDMKKETCWIHDMMLEVMVSKSIEANFVSLVGSQYAGKSYHRVRRLSIHDGEEGRNDSSSKKKTPGRGIYRSGIEGMNLKYVRSLSMFDPERNKLLDQLGEFTLLRVLDLEDCKGLENKHMHDICRMYLLRFLGLKGTDISVVPPEVGNLEHLQTLDVDQTRLSGLPETVTKLTKFERLLFSNKDRWHTMWKPPTGLSKMKALCEVSRVIIDDVEAAREIGYLEQLQAIDVYVDGKKPQKEEVRRELASSLGRTYYLRSLNVGDIIDDDHALDYLMRLSSPPFLLQYLRFAGAISALPDWVGSLTFLVEFAIAATQLANDGLLGVLCKAPSLQSVLFDYSFYTGHELVARTAYNFPSLKVMRVPSGDEWPKVFEFEEGSMRTLETLEVNFGGKTEKSIVGIKHLTNLKKVQLSGEEGNPALKLAFEQIKAESDSRPKANQFTVTVKYS